MRWYRAMLLCSSYDIALLGFVDPRWWLVVTHSFQFALGSSGGFVLKARPVSFVGRGG